MKLRDVCSELQSGKRPKGGVQGIESGIPSLGAEHLNYNGGFKFEKIKFVPKEFAEQMNKGVVRKDDIIVVKDGATTGKTSFVGSEFPFEFAVINEHVFIVRLKEDVLPKFAFYKLFSSTGHKEILEDFRGAAQGGISSGFLDKVNFPIPPLPEQQAIVSKIEELLSDLENGKQQLQTAQQQLKVYRQSLLKWAFENSNFKEYILNDVTEKIQIGPFGTQLHKEDYVENGIPLINPMHIKNGNIEADYSYSITKEKRNSLPNYILAEGDVIMGRRGEMGRCGLVAKKESGWFCGTGSLYFRPDAKKLNSLFLYYYLSSQPVKKYLDDNAGGTTMANLNLKIVNEIPIPLPSLKEQQHIVSELESKLTVCDKIEETISQNLQQAETLRQSILKKAFEGKLVQTEEFTSNKKRN